jgi:hypothetical protein
VLADAEIREGIKEYGQWPTIPQLYVGGELVGGSDIIEGMLNSGELHELLGLSRRRTPPRSASRRRPPRRSRARWPTWSRASACTWRGSELQRAVPAQAGERPRDRRRGRRPAHPLRPRQRAARRGHRHRLGRGHPRLRPVDQQSAGAARGEVDLVRELHDRIVAGAST